MTTDGLKRQTDLLAARASPEGPESLSPWDRCITRGLPDAMLPGAYNNNLQLVQTPAYVVIITEMIHEARIVPVDGGVSLPQNLRTWTGVSRGRWERDTLVVETVNFSDKANFRGAGGRLRLIERFTRTDAASIEYRLTVDDPTTWTKPWTVVLPLAKSDDRVYEYACHEGNYSLRNTLIAARGAESRTLEQR